MPPPPRQYLLGPERQLTLEGREEPLHVRAVPEALASPPAGDPRQLPLQLGPRGNSRQLALALFPWERRNPAAGVVADDLEEIVEDWPAFWAPMREEQEEVRAAGGYKYLESVRLLSIMRWIHGVRTEAAERDDAASPETIGDGCHLQISGRALARVLCCPGATQAARERRAFRVLAELGERKEIRRHPRQVTLRWATRHRPPDMQLLEVPDVDAHGREISRRRVDVHGVIYATGKGVGFIQRRGDRYAYVTRATREEERTVKVIAGPNATVLRRFSRQIRRVAARLRGPPTPKQTCIPSQTSTPGSSTSSSPGWGRSARPKARATSQDGCAHAPVAAPSGAAISSTPPVDNAASRASGAAGARTAPGSVPESKGPPPRGRRASGRYAEHVQEAARLDRLSADEMEAEKRALRAGWALPELRAEVERCWRHVVWEPAPDAQGRPVYLGSGEERMRPVARPILTAADWRPGAWAVASEDGGRAQLRRMFGPVGGLLVLRIRRGEAPPAPPWTAPPKRRRGRYDTGLHAWGWGRCKQCGRDGPLMYEADVFGRMVPLEHCEGCWDGGRWRAAEPSRPPRPATPAPVAPGPGTAELPQLPERDALRALRRLPFRRRLELYREARRRWSGQAPLSARARRLSRRYHLAQVVEEHQRKPR